MPTEGLSVTVFLYNDEVLPIDIKHIKHVRPCFTGLHLLTEYLIYILHIDDIDVCFYMYMFT